MSALPGTSSGLPVGSRGIDVRPALELLQRHVGGCREEIADGDKCWAPAEFVLWGKLIPTEGLGPRCYDHAAKHIGHHGLGSRSGWALVNLIDLAYDITKEASADASH